MKTLSMNEKAQSVDEKITSMEKIEIDSYVYYFFQF